MRTYRDWNPPMPFGFAAKDHRTVQVTWRGRTAPIDRGIARLVLALWRAEIGTLVSCQGMPRGHSWIVFDSYRAAQRFEALGRGDRRWPEVVHTVSRRDDPGRPFSYYSVAIPVGDRQHVLRAVVRYVERRRGR